MIKKLDMVSELISKGGILLGMTRKDLQIVLGQPDKEGGVSRKHKIPAIYKYGDIQFVFPAARTPLDGETQGLCYVYVDDDVEEVEEPIFLLK